MKSSSRRHPFLWLLTFVSVTTATIVASPDGVTPPADAQAAQPNVVLIVTDDQRWDTLWAMPNVQSRLVERGVSFSDAFVVNPICCPSRASLFTGLYSHNTGVYGNASVGKPYGGMAAYRRNGHEGSNLVRWLDGAGYETALIGKYLNGYNPASLRIPAGWDRWVASSSQQYYDYDVNVDGRLVSYGNDPGDYSATVETGYIDDFIRGVPASDPLFLYYAPKAPHAPTTPAPGDGSAFSGLAPWRPASYDEADVSDKPAYIRSIARFGANKRQKVDNFRRDQYRTLLAVDRTIADIVGALSDTGRLGSTMIVLTSDNGYLWGEHRWKDKHVPYEESIRVPLVIRYDALSGTDGRTEPALALNIDIAPTIAAAVGVSTPSVDGADLGPILSDESEASRNRFLVEHIRSGGVPSYCALRNESWKLVEHDTGELELYDMQADRSELVNLSDDPAHASRVASMRSTLHDECVPAPPGMTWP